MENKVANRYLSDNQLGRYIHYLERKVIGLVLVDAPIKNQRDEIAFDMRFIVTLTFTL